MDNSREDRGYHMIAPSHAYLSRGRIGEKRNVLNAPAQFVENRDSALDEGVTIGCGLDPLPAPVEQAHAKGIFQICNRL